MSAAHRLRALLEVNRAIASTLDFAEVLDLVVHHACALTGAKAAILVLEDETEHVARIMASRGVDERLAAAFSAPLDERIGRRLAELVQADPGAPIAAVPVIARDEVRGILAVGAQEEVEEREYLLSALADQAAMAIHHALRFDELRQESELRRGWLEAIHDNTHILLAYLDPELRVRAANGAYCRALGRARAEVVGRQYAQLHPPGGPTPADLRAVAFLGEPLEDQESEVVIDGRRMHWLWTARAILALDPEAPSISRRRASSRPRGIVLSALDVTDRVRDRRALELANRRKDEFLAMLAHELRNPLAAVSSATAILREKIGDDPSLGRVVAAAVRQSDQMRHLLDDLLDVSRITRGKIRLERTLVALGEVVTEAVRACESLVRERPHGIAVDVEEGGNLYVLGDRHRLLQVVSNLLVNAIKHTSWSGRISVELGARDGQARVSVVDDGDGIEPERLEEIFELFVQASNEPRAGSGGGLGIGLTLVQRIVEMHGGRVLAHSQGVGHGSRFEVWLPLQSSAPSLERTLEEEDPAEPPARDILIVDDDEDAASMLEMLLAMDGHRVRLIQNGPEALRAVEGDAPDVILLDIGLPGMDGLEVGRRLRDAGFRGLMIALTGFGQAEDRRRSRDAGFDRHLVKPVEPRVLRQILAGAG